MNVFLPRGLKVDLDCIPDDLEEQVQKAFSEYTEMTNPVFMYHDKLCFIDDRHDEIKKIKRPSRYIIILKNGDEHHFLSRAIYDRWSMGRTYMIGDVLYHSGFPFKNDWQN